MELGGDAALLEAALDGDARATNALVRRLAPSIQASVARVLVLAGSVSQRRNAQQEVEDVVQVVFETLLAEDARVLRQWSPGGAATLTTYVGRVARNVTVSTLRGRRSPWRDVPTQPDVLERWAPCEGSFEKRFIASATVRSALARVRVDLSEQGCEMLTLLFVEDRTVPEIMECTGLSATAVYQWRRRLTVRLRRALEECEP